jgi:hypothetical protein
MTMLRYDSVVYAEMWDCFRKISVEPSFRGSDVMVVLPVAAPRGVLYLQARTPLPSFCFGQNLVKK